MAVRLPDIVAHRGNQKGSDGAVRIENSYSAFESAFNNDLDIEFDVRLTKDLVPVVFHDEDLERLTGVKGRFSDYNFVDLPPLIDGSKIVSLEDLCVLFKARGGCKSVFYVELKSKEPELVLKVYEVVSRYLKYEQYYFLSFRPDFLTEIRSIDKAVRVCMLFKDRSLDQSDGVDGGKLTVLEKFVRVESLPSAREIKEVMGSLPDAVAVQNDILQGEFVEWMKGVGVVVGAWSCVEKSEGDARDYALQSVELGLDFVISDYCGVFEGVLRLL